MKRFISVLVSISLTSGCVNNSDIYRSNSASGNVVKTEGSLNKSVEQGAIDAVQFKNDHQLRFAIDEYTACIAKNIQNHPSKQASQRHPVDFHWIARTSDAYKELDNHIHEFTQTTKLASLVSKLPISIFLHQSDYGNRIEVDNSNNVKISLKTGQINILTNQNSSKIFDTSGSTPKSSIGYGTYDNVRYYTESITTTIHDLDRGGSSTGSRILDSVHHKSHYPEVFSSKNARLGLSFGQGLKLGLLFDSSYSGNETASILRRSMIKIHMADIIDKTLVDKRYQRRCSLDLGEEDLFTSDSCYIREDQTIFFCTNPIGVWNRKDLRGANYINVNLNFILNGDQLRVVAGPRYTIHSMINGGCDYIKHQGSLEGDLSSMNIRLSMIAETGPVNGVYIDLPSCSNLARIDRIFRLKDKLNILFGNKDTLKQY